MFHLKPVKTMIVFYHGIEHLLFVTGFAKPNIMAQELKSNLLLDMKATLQYYHET